MNGCNNTNTDSCTYSNTHSRALKLIVTFYTPFIN